MASSSAHRRLQKEYASLHKDPAPGSIARPLETNYLHAHFLLSGEVFWDTPYEGGVYHGVLQFPKNYPMAPPTVIMRTPSGRFQPNKKICFSMSDFHPELWNPLWSIRTILTGLVSFMNSEEITTGGMKAKPAHRADLAQKSLSHCLNKDNIAKELFGSILEGMMEERNKLMENNNGNGRPCWPPPRPVKPPPEPPQQQQRTTESFSKSKRKSNGKTTAKDTNTTGDAAAAAACEEEQQPKEELSAEEAAKNAAKNKKKREKEKRKKLYKKFRKSLEASVPVFMQAAVRVLDEKHDLDVRSYRADHVCWRLETLQEYTDLVTALLHVGRDDCTLLCESIVGGRPIATFRLKEPLSTDHHAIDVIEIPAPKPGSPYRTGLEHVEFVIGNANNNDGNDNAGQLSPVNDDAHRTALEQFVAKYPSIEWNVRGAEKAINPDVSCKIELSEELGLCGIKFHLVPLAQVIAYEQEREEQQQREARKR